MRGIYEFPSQGPVTRSFDVFFDLGLNKPLSKQSRRWWFETLSCSLWRHCNVAFCRLVHRMEHKLGQHWVCWWTNIRHAKLNVTLLNIYKTSTEAAIPRSAMNNLWTVARQTQEKSKYIQYKCRCFTIKDICLLSNMIYIYTYIYINCRRQSHCNGEDLITLISVIDEVRIVFINR